MIWAVLILAVIGGVLFALALGGWLDKPEWRPDDGKTVYGLTVLAALFIAAAVAIGLQG